MSYIGAAEKEKENIISMRRYLHENPELSQHEDNTVKFVCEKLSQYGINYTVVPKGGVLGFIGGDNLSKTVMLRADMDALPVDENPCNLKQKKQCLSKVKGVSHVCGHDSHTAMLIAAGKILKEHEKDINGRVILFFERAEEAGGNILYLLRYLYEQKIRIDGCFGVHVKGDGLKTGQIAVGTGSINAGGFGFEVTIKGKGGHGSAPSRANSPIDCFVALYQAFSLIPVKYIAADEACSFSLGKVQSGSKRNIIPDTLEFGGSFRFYEHRIGVKAKAEFMRLLASICASYECGYTVTKEIGPTLPLVNNAACAEIARNTVRNMENAQLAAFPRSMGSESFSAAQRLYPGAFAYLGIENDELGSGAANHSPEFDIDENALYLGSALEAGYAVDFLNNTEKIVFDPYNGTPDDLYREICYKVE